MISAADRKLLEVLGLTNAFGALGLTEIQAVGALSRMKVADIDSRLARAGITEREAIEAKLQLIQLAKGTRG